VQITAILSRAARARPATAAPATNVLLEIMETNMPLKGVNRDRARSNQPSQSRSCWLFAIRSTWPRHSLR